MISQLSHVVKTAITFGLVFNLSFSSYPSASTGRLALAVMAMIYGRDALLLIRRFAISNSLSLLVLIAPLPFSMFWLSFNGGEESTMVSRASWFLLFVVLAAFLYVRMCQHKLSLAMAYFLVAMLAQAIFVFYSMLNPDFRIWVDRILVESGNIDFTDGVRFSGLSNGGGAALSVQLSLGVASAIVLLSQTKSYWIKNILIIAALFLTASTIFVGRTGLYLSILMLLFTPFLFRKGLLLSFILLFIFSFFVYPLVQEVAESGVEIENNQIKLDRTMAWAFDVIITGESSSAEALASDLSYARELSSLELLIGSGRVLDANGYNYANHDSGYLQTIYAIGLPLSVAFYLVLFLIYIRLLRFEKGNLKVIGLALALMVLALEIKEPFVFKYTLPFFVFVYTYIIWCNKSAKTMRFGLRPLLIK